MADNYKPLIIGGDYSRLLQCIDDIRALILPVVEAHEAKKKETPPVEDQDSEEYCEVTALAEEMMRPSGSHHE
jgi:hypothetical protein